MIAFSGPAPRHQTVAVKVGNVTVGGGAPVVVQSMTNTDTADVEATARQVAALARTGSELVRITVDRDEAAAAVPHIKERLLRMNVDVPIVGDFHYIGHKLLADHPACAEALDKYRINPGNVGFKEKKDKQFGAIVETAIRHDKPVRIGANWGSLDQELLTHLMDENSRSKTPAGARDVTREAMVQSALLSAERAFSSIKWVSSSSSSEPQLAPMRTVLPWRIAVSTIAENCRSFLSLKPTLPGLIRYLSSASAQAG